MQNNSAKVWSSIKLVAQGLMKDSADGLHLGVKMLRLSTQILVNMYCNDHMDFQVGYCCRSAEYPNNMQTASFAALALW